MKELIATVCWLAILLIFAGYCVGVGFGLGFGVFYG